MRFAVLDLCRPEFIQDLAGLDVALPNLHGLAAPSSAKTTIKITVR